MKRTLILLTILGALAAPGALAQGQDRGWTGQFSPGEAVDASGQPSVLMSKIFQSLRSQFGGQPFCVKKVDLDGTGREVYKIVWITDDKSWIDVTVDAQTGTVISGRLINTVNLHSDEATNQNSGCVI